VLFQQGAKKGSHVGFVIDHQDFFRHFLSLLKRSPFLGCRKAVISILPSSPFAGLCS
jgi:hypothetical protein